MPFVFGFAPVLFLFIGSQIYFGLQAVRSAVHRVQSRAARLGVTAGILGIYVSYFFLYVRWAADGPTPTHMTLRDALISAPFLWWIFSSTIAFLVVVVIWILRGAARLTTGAVRAVRPPPPAPAAVPASSRRQFLEHTATAAVAAPFVAGAYGLLYGRLNLETTHRQIQLARLPDAFHGFRIAQLSDFHIGPFMSEDELRKYVRIANSLKPDMIVLTGDYLTFDPSPKKAIVNALSGLRAPYGVFGCLGNHDAWARSEDELTDLFGQVGIKILRQEHMPVRNGR